MNSALSITFDGKGNFKNLEKFLMKASKLTATGVLSKYGAKGVEALRSATPVRTGYTASCWDYRIEESEGVYSIIWTNSNVNKGVNIALIIQYGHGTNHGGYVAGIDYINPALEPLFKQFVDDIWREVTR